jgi:O-methyltransferase
MPDSPYIALIKKVLTDQIHHPSAARQDGKDWPELGFTMIGLERLENIQRCITSLLKEEIPGDFLEAGVWKGGAAMFMKAMLKEAGVENRTVWLADSFQGLPPPKPEYPADAGDTHYQHKALAISLKDVQENFRRLDLLDANVRFVEGWFHETLPKCAVEHLALLRLDGDMYESTIVTLQALYDRVAPGGYVLVDDYGYIESCRKAVHDFLDARKLYPQIHKIDWTGVYWRKSA